MYIFVCIILRENPYAGQHVQLGCYSKIKLNVIFACGTLPGIRFTGQSVLYLILIQNVMKTTKIVLHLFAIIVVFSAILLSCKKSGSTAAPDENSPIITEIGAPTGILSDTTIGPSGGTLQSADGRLTVTIPADALSSATTISIQPITNNAPLGLGFGYRLLPEGVTFAKPVELTFHYDDQLLQQSPEDFLWIVTQASDRSWNAMLKSVLDKNGKTVSVTTVHFSDYLVGRFLEMTLTPASPKIQTGYSLQLRLTGFRGDLAKEDDELTPLAKIKDDGLDELHPLTPITPLKYTRLLSFKIKQWSQNGVAAPVSNSHGSLNASGTGATYKAPDQIPTNNPVAVSVQLEAKTQGGSTEAFLFTSNITIVDDAYYLLVKIDGQEFKYLQIDTSWNTRINCFLDEGHFQIIADMDGASVSENVFNLAFSNPSVTTRILNGPTGASNNLGFSPVNTIMYTLDYEQRTITTDSSCIRKSQYGNATATLTEYTGPGAVARGYFSGTLYEDNSQLDLHCKMPIAHSIEGEFWLLVNSQK
jgi:hypothetical protein